MYRIICPTDFSEVSKNALLYAISLVNDLGGHLHVVNFYEVPHATGHEQMMDDMIREGAEKEMEQLITASTQWLSSDRSIDYLVHRGECAEQLRIMAKDDQFDLIVMGSQNSTHKMKLIFGSTTKSVINHVDRPTIVVPPSIKYRPIEKIVFAAEGIIRDSLLEFIAEFGDNTLRHLYFLHVGDINVEKELIDHYGRFMSDYSYSFHNIEGDDILNGINMFAGEVEADLLIMEKKKKNFFQRLFGVSHTDLELFRAEIPLMVLHHDS